MQLRRIRRLLRHIFSRPDLSTGSLSRLVKDRYPEFDIGRYSYGDLRVVRFENSAGLRVGSFCSVAAGVRVFLGGEHRTDVVSTYPFDVFWPSAQHLSVHPVNRGDVVIGNDVWIGAEALIRSGVTIGDGAVIGARAVVTRDVEPYSIVAGNPARFVRLRFSPETVSALLAIQWWNWPDERISRAAPLLLGSDIGAFIRAANAGEI